MIMVGKQSQATPKAANAWLRVYEIVASTFSINMGKLLELPEWLPSALPCPFEHHVGQQGNDAS